MSRNRETLENKHISQNYKWIIYEGFSAQSPFGFLWVKMHEIIYLYSYTGKLEVEKLPFLKFIKCISYFYP